MIAMAPSTMADCIRNCWECRTLCLSTLSRHCLFMGGAHVEHGHVIHMMDCIEACQICADFMTRGSTLHRQMCGVCAAACEACALSCDTLDTPEMRACAKACRECVITCTEMSATMEA